MSLQEERNESLIEGKSDWILSFCEGDRCEGVPVQAHSQEFMEDQECSICIESLEGVRHVVLGSCLHIFCETCLKNWREK